MNTQVIKKKLSRVLLKVIVVNVLNVFVLVGLLIVLNEIPKRALEVKTATTKMQAAQQNADAAVLEADIEKNKEKLDLIQSVFSGDKTLIAFISHMEDLKTQNTVSSYEFPITNEIADKTGLKGLPVTVTIVGNPISIQPAISQIFDTTSLLKPVSLTIETAEDGNSIATLGAFLYISQ